MGSLSLLQGIFLTQGWDLGLPHEKQILYNLSHQGSPCVCVCVHVCVYIMYVCMYMYEVKQSESESRSVVSVGPHRLHICDPMDYAVHGILQARMLEWVAIPFSRESSQPRG